MTLESGSVTMQISRVTSLLWEVRLVQVPVLLVERVPLLVTLLTKSTPPSPLDRLPTIPVVLIGLPLQNMQV